MSFKLNEKQLSRKALESLLYECSHNEKLMNDKDVQIVINTGSKKINIKKDFVPRVIPLTTCKMSQPKDLRILLITKDPSTLYRESIAKDDSIKDLIKEIISVKNLKRRFRGAKINALYKEFDLVVADYRVHHLLPSILGHKFFSGTKKIPFVIKMSKTVKMRRQKMPEECDTKYLRAQLKSICKNAYFVPNNDNCLNVKIGNIDKQTVDEMLKNVVDIVRFLTDSNERPQGGVIRSGIASIFVKTSNSASLPLYEATTKQGNGIEVGDDDLASFKL